MTELKIDEGKCGFGGVVSVEMMESFKVAIDHLMLTIPIGQVAPIYIYDIEGFPEINKEVWQECDGGVITNIKSPLYNPETPSDLSEPFNELSVNRVPDMRDRYLRMSTVFSADGSVGGDNYIDLHHNHGGNTAYTRQSNSDGDAGGSHTSALRNHRHGISYDLKFPINFEPEFYGLKFYMRLL